MYTSRTARNMEKTINQELRELYKDLDIILKSKVWNGLDM